MKAVKNTKTLIIKGQINEDIIGSIKAAGYTIVKDSDNV